MPILFGYRNRVKAGLTEAGSGPDKDPGVMRALTRFERYLAGKPQRRE